MNLDQFISIFSSVTSPGRLLAPEELFSGESNSNRYTIKKKCIYFDIFPWIVELKNSGQPSKECLRESLNPKKNIYIDQVVEAINYFWNPPEGRYQQHEITFLLNYWSNELPNPQKSPISSIYHSKIRLEKWRNEIPNSPVTYTTGDNYSLSSLHSPDNDQMELSNIPHTPGFYDYEDEENDVNQNYYENINQNNDNFKDDDEYNAELDFFADYSLNTIGNEALNEKLQKIKENMMNTLNTEIDDKIKAQVKGELEVVNDMIKQIQIDIVNLQAPTAGGDRAQWKPICPDQVPSRDDWCRPGCVFGVYRDGVGPLGPQHVHPFSDVVVYSTAPDTVEKLPTELSIENYARVVMVYLYFLNF